MPRKIYNNRDAVYGWITTERHRTNIFAYSKGLIGYILNEKVYDEKNKLIGSLNGFNLEDYIVSRNSVTDSDYRRRKLKHESIILSFKEKDDN